MHFYAISVIEWHWKLRPGPVGTASAADRATTPPKSGAVFVLLENGDPGGTAFAVQCERMDKLITAGHNIHNPRVEKDALGHKIAYGTWRNPKRVQVVDMGSEKYNQNDCCDDISHTTHYFQI